MNNSTSHSLAVKTPLSRLYLALFSAPLLLFLPADIVRAADAFLMATRVLPKRWVTPVMCMLDVINAEIC